MHLWKRRVGHADAQREKIVRPTGIIFDRAKSWAREEAKSGVITI